MKTVEYNTCHILVVDNEGNLLQQIKIRESRDYSRKYMLEKGAGHLCRIAQRDEIFEALK
jgi:hypothetical protein